MIAPSMSSWWICNFL